MTNLSVSPRLETKSRFIKEHEVTLTRLKDELAKAMIDAKLGRDGSLFTALSSPVWIEIQSAQETDHFQDLGSRSALQQQGRGVARSQ